MNQMDLLDANSASRVAGEEVGGLMRSFAKGTRRYDTGLAGKGGMAFVRRVGRTRRLRSLRCQWCQRDRLLSRLRGRKGVVKGKRRGGKREKLLRRRTEEGNGGRAGLVVVCTGRTRYWRHLAWLPEAQLLAQGEARRSKAKQGEAGEQHQAAQNQRAWHRCLLACLH